MRRLFFFIFLAALLVTRAAPASLSAAPLDPERAAGASNLSMASRSIALPLVIKTGEQHQQSTPDRSREGLWLSTAEIMALPTSGPAWENLYNKAQNDTSHPNLKDQDDLTDVHTLAKALVYVRLGDSRYRNQVVETLARVPETENGGRTLALGRNLVAYIIAADLISYDSVAPAQAAAFRAWLAAVRHEELDGRSLISTHEERPNNWGTHAGASRIAIALYLHDRADLERAAQVFRGWLGDRSVYAGFNFGDDLSWQANPGAPVGINPAGATRNGHSIDGVLPDDQRRGGGFTWPAPQENYVWEALQGAAVQAQLLARAGFDSWQWSDRALLRAVTWLHQQDHYPAQGDDTWLPHLINRAYGASFPTQIPARPGKNVGWTDWTHAS